MARLSFQQAVVKAIETEMHRDRDVFVMGEDIGAFGGPLKSNEGLWELFGKEGRVIDTPLSEGSFTGVGVGAALAGKRPVVDLMFLEFLGLAIQQLIDGSAMHYYSNGKARVPLVLRGKYGIGPFHGHAYDFHSWAASVPGMKIVSPSNPADAMGLMRAAIRDDNPVLFLEHMALYHAGRDEVPDDDGFVVPLGKAAILREGSDITIVATAFMTKRAMQAAKELARDGIEAEIIDPRTIVPLDVDTILQSVRKTGRLLVVTETPAPASVAGDIVVIAASQAFEALKAAPQILTPPHVPVPFARELENIYLPAAEAIVERARRITARA